MDKKIIPKPINIERLKRELEKINIERDINNILRRNKNPGRKSTTNSIEQKETSENKNNELKFNPKENKKRNELLQELEYLRTMYINKFIEDAKKKTDAEAKNTITLEGKNFEKKVQLVVKKAQEELNSYIQKLESLEEKNRELTTNINMVQSHKNYLEAQLKEAEISINKINKKFEIFNDLKPYYDELINEFNVDKDNYNPKEKLLSSDMKKRREEASKFEDLISERREKIIKLMEMKRTEDFDNRKLNEEISSNLREIELKNRNIEEEYNDKFMKIKQEIDSLFENKEENIKIRNSFVSIFNLFYPKLYLERNLNVKPKELDLLKPDYTPKTYETDEVVKYIYLMLKNSSEDSAGRLLREIVSYCNMMLRDTVKGKDNAYYEPLSTVKQIESLITAKEKQNDELKSIIDSNTRINDQNQERINELELEIKRIEKMHEILHNKMRDFYKKNKKDIKEYPTTIIRDSKRKIKFDLNKIDNIKKRNISRLTNFVTQESTIKKDSNFFRTKTEIDSDKNRFYIPGKIDFSQGIQQLVEHANRLFFYQAHLNKKPREIGVYLQAHKRLKKKMNKLKKIEQNIDKFTSVEKAVSNTLNDHIDYLIQGLKALNH